MRLRTTTGEQDGAGVGGWGGEGGRAEEQVERENGVYMCICTSQWVACGGGGGEREYITV